MKKIIMFCTLTLSIFTMKAQEEGTVSVFFNGGYTFDETIPYDFTDLEVAGGFQWGGGLEYFVDKDVSIDLKYTRLDTDFSARIPVGNGVNVTDSGSMQYYLFGGTKYFNSGSKAVPYFGGSIGVGIMDSEDFSAQTGFAWDIKAGVKIKTDGPVSVKLQAYLQSILSTNGSDYWYYWGYAYSVPDYHRALSFGLGAVLAYDFKAKTKNPLYD